MFPPGAPFFCGTAALRYGETRSAFARHGWRVPDARTPRFGDVRLARRGPASAGFLHAAAGSGGRRRVVPQLLRADAEGGDQDAEERDPGGDSRPSWKPSTKSCGFGCAGLNCVATIAPMSARPTEPPTWRIVLMHGRADARLVDRNRVHRGGGRRRHRHRHPEAADEERRAGASRRSSSRPGSRRGGARCRDSARPGTIIARGPSLSESRPAFGATNMIRTVIGRNVAPACIGE